MTTIEEELRVIKTKRGEIVTNFAYIELLMSELIAFHYTETDIKAKELQEDILEDEYLSFGIRKRIFEKLMKRHYSETEFNFGKLTELGNIRNIIAHATIKAAHINFKVEVSPYYYHGAKSHDCDLIHKKYDKLRDEIMPILKKLAKSETIEEGKITSKEE